MLPFDNRPWAKPLARTVIGLSIIAAVVGAYYLYSVGELHVPEITGLVLLLLTIIPPNVAIVMRKTANHSAVPATTNTAAISPTLHPR